MKKTFLSLILFASLFFGLACQADEFVGVAVDQSVFSFNLNPKENKEFSLRVKNISKLEQKVFLETQDISIEENNKVSFLPAANEINGMKDWIKSEEKYWVFGPGEEKEVKLNVDVPEKAIPGSHFAVLLVRAVSNATAENILRPIVEGKIGVEILVNVGGDISGKGKIVDFQAPVLAEKKIILKTEFQNEGTIHYIPHGEIEIKNIFFGKEKKINIASHFVFPGRKYLFEENFDVESLLGIYTAKASFVDGEGSIHSSSRVIFGKYSLIVILFIMVSIFVIFEVFCKITKKKNEKN